MPPEQPEKKEGWAARVLAEPRLVLAMLVGALVGLPGATYNLPSTWGDNRLSGCCLGLKALPLGN